MRFRQADTAGRGNSEGKGWEVSLMRGALVWGDESGKGGVICVKVTDGGHRSGSGPASVLPCPHLPVSHLPPRFRCLL